MLAAESQSFLEIVTIGGGWIGAIIWALSIILVGLIVTNMMQIRRATILPEPLLEQVREMFSGKKYREVIDMTATESSFLSGVLNAALSDAAHGYPAMERAMEEAAEERSSKMLRKIEYLNLIGNISPMLGLFGTVYGMIGAFFKMAEQAGKVDASTLASEIGVALVTTLLGLAVAIPALAVYAIMRNRIDALTSETMVASQELISAFRPSKG